MPEQVAGVPGVDVPRLSSWLAETLPGQERITGIELLAGGRSNLTYLLRLGERRVVLRRPPLGHVLPTAHDMRREHTVLSALAGSDVPVPAPLALCTDEDVIGAVEHLRRSLCVISVKRLESRFAKNVRYDHANKWLVLDDQCSGPTRCHER